MAVRQSGSLPFRFIHRSDLRGLPQRALPYEVNLHGGFASDKRVNFGHLYYGMPGLGLLRVEPDLTRQEWIELPDHLAPMNFHSTKIGYFDGKWRLFLPANNDAQVVVVSLDGKLDYVLSRPEFEQYQNPELPFAPTDTALVDGTLFVADGYGANYISAADIKQKQWVAIFGGKTEDPTVNGLFSTAHGISVHPNRHHQLVIADRPSSRIQVHHVDGSFIASHGLPPGAWPCGIDYLSWEGRQLAVIGSLFDPVKDRPAPIYIVDFSTFEVLSTIRPKEELGIDLAQHLHNVVFHVHQGQLYLVCQSWNPGHYFVLERV